MLLGKLTICFEYMIFLRNILFSTQFNSLNRKHDLSIQIYDVFKEDYSSASKMEYYFKNMNLMNFRRKISAGTVVETMSGATLRGARRSGTGGSRGGHGPNTGAALRPRELTIFFAPFAIRDLNF